MQLSLFGLLLLTQPLHSSEQHTRANLEFSSNFEYKNKIGPIEIFLLCPDVAKSLPCWLCHFRKAKMRQATHYENRFTKLMSFGIN